MTTNIPRIGFHYFPDTAHYRQIDLDTWLPELQHLGASGVTLLAPPERAIPERFITGLLSAGIEPTLHFPFHCHVPASQNDARLAGDGALGVAVPGCIPLPIACPPLETLRLLLNAYARWGVRRVAFFDRPNLRSMWSPSAWLQGDLVERFLDLFLPVALLALDAGLSPLFPPLAPGGDYWDLSFLCSALRGLKRRRVGLLLNRLILSAEAFAGERPLEWGAGGPDRWSSTRPYHTPAGEQDHLGFRIFEWYLAIARQELGDSLPVVLLRAGQRFTGVSASPAEAVADVAPTSQPATPVREHEGEPPVAAQIPVPGPQFAAGIAHARQTLAVADLLAAAPEDGGLPPEVMAGHFWLLSAAPRAAAAPESWFPPAGQLLPVVSAFQAWAAHRLGTQPVALFASLPAVSPVPSPPRSGDEPEGNAITPNQPEPTLENRSPGADELAAPPPATSPVPPSPRDGEGSGGRPLPSYHPKAIFNQGVPVAGKTLAATRPLENADDNLRVFSPKHEGDDAHFLPRLEAIDHYILLPLYAWGAADWDLALVQPLIQQGHPTIGFSLSEARLARRVTVVGGPGAVSTEALGMLRRNGCQVERLMEDGTLVASSE